jgi:hypothetical protein
MPLTHEIVRRANRNSGKRFWHKWGTNGDGRIFNPRAYYLSQRLGRR